MNKQTVELYYREYGDPQAPTLMLVHGLFGSSVNWAGIARRLQADYRILVPDLRNHGRSPHTPAMNYELMAQDLLHLMESLHIHDVRIIGHSMGGKVAMWLALQHPEHIEKLVVADIAPVNYQHRFDAIFTGLHNIALDRLGSREAAQQQLSTWVGSPEVRQYLLQNLVKQSGGWRWRFNLTALTDAIEDLTGFPETEQSFPGDVLFLYGGNSDYVKGEYQPAIRAYFPHARLRMLAGSGHWVYAEQPEAFVKAVTAFL